MLWLLTTKARFMTYMEDKCHVYEGHPKDHVLELQGGVDNLEFLVGIINTIRKNNNNQMGPKKKLDQDHEIVGKKFLFSLCKVSRIWFFFLRFTLWTIWMERNNYLSNILGWMNKKMQALLGKTLLTMRELLGRKRLQTMRESPFIMICLLSSTWCVCWGGVGWKIACLLQV